MFYKLHYEKINDEKNDLVNKNPDFICRISKSFFMLFS